MCNKKESFQSPENEVSGLVRLVCLDQGVVAGDGLLHDVVPAAEGLALPGGRGDGDGSVRVVLDGRAALVDEGAVGGGGEEGGDAGAAGADALSEGALKCIMRSCQK